MILVSSTGKVARRYSEPDWLGLVFCGLLMVNMIVAISASYHHPSLMYDERFHLEDIERFARLGWSQEAFLERQNYAGPLGYFIPAMIYRHAPSLKAMRCYSLITMCLGLLAAAWLGRRWTGSWLPGTALVCFPHVTMCLTVFMTEGAALLLMSLGLILIERGFRAGKTTSWIWSLLGGIFIALAILHRQIWMIVPGGLLAVALLSCWRSSLSHLQRHCFLSSIVVAMGVIIFTVSAGGIFIGGMGQTISDRNLMAGNWLLSFLAFLPWYGAGIWWLVHENENKYRIHRPLLCLSLLVSGGLVLAVAFSDSPESWLGHGPINHMIRILNIGWAKPWYLFIFSTLGLCLLAVMSCRFLQNPTPSFSEAFRLGCLGSMAFVVTGALFPTTFYERYMFTPLFCVLITLDGSRFRLGPWLLQITILFLFQLGVNYSNGLYAWILY